MTGFDKMFARNFVQRSQDRDVVARIECRCDAAEMLIPKRDTGSVYSVCAYARAATAPLGSKEAITLSMYALSCTTPRPAPMGKFRPGRCGMELVN